MVQFADNSLTIAKTEGETGTTTAFTFTVERTGGTVGQVDFTVNLASAGVNSSDFVGSPALPMVINGSIPAGSASATVTVNVRGDGAIEPNEAFTLTITGATNSASAPTTVNADQDVATGRILTDDVIGTDIDGVTILETAELLHGSETTPEATNAIQLVRLGTFTATNNGSGGNAEVVTFDPVTDQLFILNAIGNSIEIVRIWKQRPVRPRPVRSTCRRSRNSAAPIRWR